MDCPANKVTVLDTPTCTASPEDGYAFTGASAKYGDGSAASMSCDTATKVCTLTGVTGDVTVSANFTPNEYSVSDATPAGAGGTMDCPTKVTVLDKPICTAQPDTGYVFTGASAKYGNGSDANMSCDTATRKCTLTGVTGDVSIDARFTLKKYSVTIDTATGSSINCNHAFPATLTHGSTLECTAATPPDESYKFSSLSFGNKTCNALPCNFTITNDGELKAVFSKKKYAVNVSASEGGRIACNGAAKVEVEHGGSLTCDLSTNAGYRFAGATRTPETVAGIDCSSGEQCQLFSITGAVSVFAEFKKVYEVTGIADPADGGTFNCTSPVDEGGDTTCTAEPVKGYSFTGSASLAPDGKASVECKGKDTCTVSGVKGDVTVTGTFAKDGFSVTSINENPKNTTRLKPGEPNTVKFSVSVGGVPLDKGTGTLEIKEPGKSHALQKASFSGGAKSVEVNIAGGEFTAVITPEKGEKTVFLKLSIPAAKVEEELSLEVSGSVAGTAAPVPTMSGIGLLLSGMALAGAAAPALRRREQRKSKERKRN